MLPAHEAFLIEAQLLAAEGLGCVRPRDVAKIYLLCDDVSRMLT